MSFLWQRMCPAGWATVYWWRKGFYACAAFESNVAKNICSIVCAGIAIGMPGWIILEKVKRYGEEWCSGRKNHRTTRAVLYFRTSWSFLKIRNLCWTDIMWNLIIVTYCVVCTSTLFRKWDHRVSFVKSKVLVPCREMRTSSGIGACLRRRSISWDNASPSSFFAVSMDWLISTISPVMDSERRTPGLWVEPEYGWGRHEIPQLEPTSPAQLPIPADHPQPKRFRSPPRRCRFYPDRRGRDLSVLGLVQNSRCHRRVSPSEKDCSFSFSLSWRCENLWVWSCAWCRTLSEIVNGACCKSPLSRLL